MAALIAPLSGPCRPSGIFVVQSSIPPSPWRVGRSITKLVCENEVSPRFQLHRKIEPRVTQLWRPDVLQFLSENIQFVRLGLSESCFTINGTHDVESRARIRWWIELPSFWPPGGRVRHFLLRPYNYPSFPWAKQALGWSCLKTDQVHIEHLQRLLNKTGGMWSLNARW